MNESLQADDAALTVRGTGNRAEEPDILLTKMMPDVPASPFSSQSPFSNESIDAEAEAARLGTSQMPAMVTRNAEQDRQPGLIFAQAFQATEVSPVIETILPVAREIPVLEDKSAAPDGAMIGGEEIDLEQDDVITDRIEQVRRALFGSGEPIDQSGRIPSALRAN